MKKEIDTIMSNSRILKLLKTCVTFYAVCERERQTNAGLIFPLIDAVCVQSSSQVSSLID